MLSTYWEMFFTGSGAPCITAGFQEKGTTKEKGGHPDAETTWVSEWVSQVEEVGSPARPSTVPGTEHWPDNYLMNKLNLQS